MYFLCLAQKREVRRRRKNQHGCQKVDSTLLQVRRTNITYLLDNSHLPGNKSLVICVLSTFTTMFNVSSKLYQRKDQEGRSPELTILSQKQLHVSVSGHDPVVSVRQLQVQCTTRHVFLM